jgi:hypothetical protein
MDSTDPIERLIQVWHDSVVEFGQQLEDFINGLPPERARFWGIDLWLFLQDQRRRGFKVDGASYQRLRSMLDELRDDLIAQGVTMQQAYTPSAAQKARERDGIRARNEHAAPPQFARPAMFAAAAPDAPPQAPAPTSPAPPATGGNAPPPGAPGTTTTPPATGGTTGTASPGTASPPKPGTTTTPRPTTPAPNSMPRPPRGVDGVGAVGGVLDTLVDFGIGVYQQKKANDTADAHRTIDEMVKAGKLSDAQAKLWHFDIEHTPFAYSSEELATLQRINDAQLAGKIDEAQAQALVRDLPRIREKHRGLLASIDFDAVRRDVDSKISALAAQNPQPATQQPASGTGQQPGPTDHPDENPQRQRFYRGDAQSPTIDLTDKDRLQVRFTDKGGPAEMVKTERGISVNRSLTKLKTVKPPVREVVALPGTLSFRQQGNDPDHFEVVPTKPITWNQYKTEVKKIQLGPIQ